MLHLAYGFTGSQYALDTEYSGANFFEGWDFFTDRDPTGGFVTYYSQSSSWLKGLIQSSDDSPAYIGVDYVNELPLTSDGHADGAGRPSVRISSQRSWTHGVFVGDFTHAPNGICGTWPAFWTLGPNWPYTGEIDILEGVNKMVANAVALHSNETCTISGNATTQIGILGNANCAYYPNSNVGCGVADTRPASYSDFNSVGGGVYAMQWTSEYIRVWFFPRNHVPQDIINKTPDPSSWGLPAANMMGNCDMDQHFQQHKIVLDTTFCGDYAGNPYVWNSNVNSCARDTGYMNCDAYVAKNPGAFRDAYWSVNYVRVYQLVNPDSPEQGPQYIASLQPSNAANQQAASTAEPASPMGSLCPTYNFTTVQTGGLTYEIECDFDPPGPDLPPPYTGFPIRSFEDCVAGCTYWNTVNGTNLCGGVSYDASIPFCYYKKYINKLPNYRHGFAGARLMYYGYPQITDDPRSQLISRISTFVEIIPTPQTYRPSMTGAVSSNTFTSFNTTSIPLATIAPPPLGTVTATSGIVGPTIESGMPTVSFSGTISVPVTNLTVVSPSTPISTASTNTALTQPSSSSSAIGPGPSSIGGFRYAGCNAIQQSDQTFYRTTTTSNMTLELCMSYCGGAHYAGVYGSGCYCAKSSPPDGSLIQYPDSACDIPCPGKQAEYCGGNSPNTTSSLGNQKRQGATSASTILLTLYYNTALVSTTHTTSTNTRTMTLIHMSQPTVFGGIIYSITGARTITATVISTTWCDYCPTCPGYQTTRSTAINVPVVNSGSGNHAINPHVVVPMMTTIRSCNCGVGGAASTTTVTIPCETQIAAMTNAVGTSNGVPAMNSVGLIGVNYTTSACHHCSHHVVAPTTQTQGNQLTLIGTPPVSASNTSNWNVSTPALTPGAWTIPSFPPVFTPNIFHGHASSLRRVCGISEIVAVSALLLVSWL